MRLESYAQELEDLILYSALRNVKKGFYIDVGANDPTIISVTRFFYDRGWRGINIEPQPTLVKMLEEERPRDINLCVGVGKERGKLTLYGKGVMATFSEEVKGKENDMEGTEVDIITLSDIYNKFLPPLENEVHFCKIDVEGFEKEVLKGISNWDEFRPWIYVIEATEPGTDIPCYEKWEYILLEHGYDLAFFFGINRYYLDRRKQHLTEYFLDLTNFLKQHDVFKVNMQYVPM